MVQYYYDDVHSVYPVGLDLERHSCPWILLWAGQGEADGFGFGFGFSFAISVQTRSIAILSNKARAP
jgi:hypothetical protein